MCSSDLLNELLKEQKERHEGGSKWIGTGGTSPFGANGFNPQGIRIGQEKSRNKSAVNLVVVLFVFHQNRAAQVVEVVYLVSALTDVAVGVQFAAVGADYASFKRLKQHEVFLHGNRQLGRTQGVEKIDEHRDDREAFLEASRFVKKVEELRFYLKPFASAEAVNDRVPDSAVTPERMAANHAIFAHP